MRVFVEIERDNLAEMIRTYGPGSAFNQHEWHGRLPYDLARSSAVLAVCKRLSTKPLAFEVAWRDRWESGDMLEDVRSVWGTR